VVPCPRQYGGGRRSTRVSARHVRTLFRSADADRPHAARRVVGKGISVPDVGLLDRLYKRNESLISSHHPLRETLITQTGVTAAGRRQMLVRTWNEAQHLAIHTWSPGTTA